MNTIDIRTTQNVSIEYELASLQHRFLALLIDFFILGVSYFIFLLLLLSTDINSIDGVLSQVILFFLPLSLFFFYQLLSEVIANGQSFGKKIVGIKVVRLDGREPSLGDYLLRAIFHLMDTFFSLGVVGAILISASSKHQRLGDIAANTSVIRVKLHLRFRLEDILKINTIENYEVSYPEVKKLTEADMLLIKSIISRYQNFTNPAHQKIIAELVQNLKNQLDIQKPIKDKIHFLKTLIRDYIVLTR